MVSLVFIKGMNSKNVCVSLYRQVVKVIMCVEHINAGCIARERYAEFLPHGLVVSENDTLLAIAQRAFVKSPLTSESLANGFAFLKTARESLPTLEVLAHWEFYTRSGDYDLVEGIAIMSAALRLAREVDKNVLPLGCLPVAVTEIRRDIQYIAQHIKSVIQSQSGSSHSNICSAIVELQKDNGYKVSEGSVEDYAADDICRRRRASAILLNSLLAMTLNEMGCSCGIAGLEDQQPSVRLMQRKHGDTEFISFTKIQEQNIGRSRKRNTLPWNPTTRRKILFSLLKRQLIALSATSGCNTERLRQQSCRFSGSRRRRRRSNKKHMAHTRGLGSNALVLGEFCEIEGAVARLLFCFSSSLGRPEMLAAEEWSPALVTSLDELMTICMSADYTMRDDLDENIAFSPVSFFHDGLQWGFDSATAHVTRVNIPDVFARGHQRTLCVAFVSLSSFTSLSVCRWISEFGERLACQLADGALQCFVSDAQKCCKALSMLMESSSTDMEVDLSATTRAGLQQEFQTLSRMKHKDCFICESTTETDSMTLKEAAELAEDLIGCCGKTAPRPLSAICSDSYATVMDGMESMLWYFSLDASWMMEGVLGTMPSTLSSFSCSYIDAETHGDGNGNAFVFAVGEWPVLAPLDAPSGLFPSPPVPPSRQFTALNDPSLYAVLRKFGIQNIVDVAYAALQCRTVIVCGSDEGCVLGAMKVVCVFVPGLLQSEEHGVRLGTLPFCAGGRTLTLEDVHRFAVIGCHVDAAVRDGKPIFPQACVWHVERRHDRRKKKNSLPLFHSDTSLTNLFSGSSSAVFRTEKLWSERYGSFHSSRKERSSVVPPPAVVETRDGFTDGLLWELAGALQQKATTREQSLLFSDLTRLLLKRIFFQYCSLASYVLQDILRRCSGPYDSSANLVISPTSPLKVSDCKPAIPQVWSDMDTARTLHGHTALVHSDLVIVTAIVKRMIHLVAEHTCS